MDYEAEINDLKRRVEELETCCAEFRSCKGPMTERIEAVEKRHSPNCADSAISA